MRALFTILLLPVRTSPALAADARGARRNVRTTLLQDLAEHR